MRMFSILRILPVFCSGFYLQAVERYRRLVAVKNERLELVTREEAERDNLRTVFYIQGKQIISSRGYLCGQNEGALTKTLYICNLLPYDSDWFPYIIDSGNTVQIRNKSETKCFGYSTRIDILHNYIKELDCDHLNETRFTMIYESGRFPAHHHLIDRKWR